MTTWRGPNRGLPEKFSASRSCRLTNARRNETEQPSVVTTNCHPMLHARHSSTLVRSVITITGLGDHDQPDWLITMTGIRKRTEPDPTDGHCRAAELGHASA